MDLLCARTRSFGGRGPLLQAAILDLPLPRFFHATLEKRLLLLKEAPVRLVLRGISDVEALAAVRVGEHVVLLPLVSARNQSSLGERLQVPHILRGIRGQLAKARL